MGKKENSLIEYYNKNQRFAELINGYFFDGKAYLQEEMLSDADRRQEHSTGRGGRWMRHRYRDIWKQAKGMRLHVIIGAEIQEHVDYAMPLRVADMDILGYLRQKKLLSGKFRQNLETVSKDEFLSGMQKEDKLVPEVTLVLYLGEKPWDGAKSLHEMLDFEEVPEEMREYIEDYRIHILDVKHTSDEELRKFPRDIRFMLLFIKYTEDKEALMRLKELAGCEEVEEDTFETLSEYVNEPALMEWKKKEERKGDISMCNGLRELIADGRAEGKEEGEKIALDKLNRLTLLLSEQNRLDELVKAAKNPEYQQKLFSEFGL